MLDEKTNYPLPASTNSAPEGEVYEIFQGDERTPVPHHGGNVRAPDRELVVHYAREFYGRRQESSYLWIVPRTAIGEIVSLGHEAPVVHPLVAGSELAQGPQTFALFGQKHAGKPLTWLEDCADMTLTQAAEHATHYSRQEAYVRFWLCPRAAISELANLDLLQPPLDRSYRRLDGYNIRDKLRIARERVMREQGKG
jgi:1,2-phenylacetyl-CoA epoxidase PaaB subunit